MNSSGGGGSDNTLCYHNTSGGRRQEGRKYVIKLISVAILTSLGSDGCLTRVGLRLWIDQIWCYDGVSGYGAVPVLV